MKRPDTGPVAEVARAELDDKFAAREIGVTNSRKIIRASANAIRALHRDETGAAAELIARAGHLLEESADALASHQDILHAGFFADAAKEYAEAQCTAALLAGEALPMPDVIGVPVAAYLKGLGETVGELRRRLLDRLRVGELDEAESVFRAMEAIQDMLETMDYPDGMTGGLRRTTDVARSLVERSRADLTNTIVQERLRRELADRTPPGG